PAGLAEAARASGGVVAVVELGSGPMSLTAEATRRAARMVPGVVVGVAPAGLSPEARARWAELVDVILPTSSAAPVDDELEQLTSAVGARPKAAAALVLLLRQEPATIEDGLVAESAVYSMLQAGPEFAAWLRTRQERAPDRAAEGPAVRMARDGDRLTVTLSRSARHNALNTAMRDALVEALGAGLTDPSVTVVLQGDGASFCSGGDLSEFGTAPDPATSHVIRLTRSPAALAARLAPRLEVRVHGACIGAGIELAAFAGRVVARPDAVFALPELTLGLIPGSGGTVSVRRRIGRHRTAWLALSGERIDARRAHAWGLVDEVV
ncbi:MAG TPA: enoyl-CoA hydratase/isomerase family protein, partial [Acidimicrobiia bacterium]|nr:enoyl-CoA hydratase/isomerase family protein [Acidimicrobiia bacterium]